MPAGFTYTFLTPQILVYRNFHARDMPLICEGVIVALDSVQPENSYIDNGQCNYNYGLIIVLCLRFMATSNSKVDKKMCFCDRKIMIPSVKHLRLTKPG